ncbi:diguanylate cyclase (GGDEF) domain-containing protein [Ruminococcus sp. YE71]|uniref:putative bifunctional diguanylate cyclase/phosphodiesterase n=1 Tax=unclassified Ruminococcus TaxID=2608920 RepID=UPI0008914833|nr:MULTISPECIES: GGDEF and EAL domain-containing protein [unclassified Ruminococcus]SDA25087.1 diguanylate cyclase (GGDEF) domain-containing protein [Ruminococcus sp. YE78]SFW43034.1 diguanylate cyclase (GGDEF) domain-containing protein [Ruminococcus sp. YE71]
MNAQVSDMNVGGIIPEGLPGGFFVYEASEKENIIFADMNVVRLYGCETYEEFLEFVGGSFTGMVHPDDLHKIENEIQAQTIFGEKRHDYVRYRIVNKQGETRYIEDFGHLLHRLGGKGYFYVFIVDVDKNEFFNRSRNSYAEAEILAQNQETDRLTGLFNMSFFYYKVQMLLSAPDSYRKNYSIVYFDIPNFKLYNERHGFKLGDELLCDLAKLLRDEFKDGTVARFSDDHFFVFANGTREEIVIKIESVYKRLLLSEDPNKKVRIKAGMYFLDGRSSEIGLACDHARLACNSIKSRHDVIFCIYDEMLREKLRRQQYVVDHIDEAIEHEDIKVYYQPVIRVETGEICGYEALVRWSDEKFGLLSPSDFIETLEQFHLIHLVDRYVVGKVCDDLRSLIENGEPAVPVSINISRLDFELCDIFAIIEEIRHEYGIPRAMLDIEITESALNDNVGYIKSECDRMRRMGYHIWLDDFGSGYSSLNTIAEYDFDVLKLDLLFLRSLSTNSKTGTLMTYIVNGARDMNLDPLCEGVESEEQFEFLKKIGCERAQGFYFGKPMPMNETRAYTRSKGLKWEQRSYVD